MDFISVAQTAKMLGVSRVQVFRKIKQGKIKAQKVGRAYVVDKNSLGPIFEQTTDREVKLIDQAVAGTISEYGETLRRLGRE
ncbi:helix-turn-helix domain-containing protein [Patescibacteria group bacterium]|nr:helix-turn-helix domain-containing protein [Patescibacteria group bacterium]MBU1931414.1 helix-turn-helix domain-containing protein [Patescibacteria group bacterium]